MSTGTSAGRARKAVVSSLAALAAISATVGASNATTAAAVHTGAGPT